MKKVSAILFIALGVLSALVAAACIVAAILAWNAVETLAAIESIFGSLIAALLFALLSRSLLRAGKERLKGASAHSTHPETDVTQG